MKFIDLNSQYNKISQSINKRINNVLKHGQYILGPEVEELESELANYVNVKYCISCSSGTDALLMVLLAKGIGPGDSVITTPFTYVATAEVIAILGATPIFVDIDDESFNISPKLIEQCIKENADMNIKMIIPVNIFGLPADYDAINKIATKHDLFVLEDSAQSFGANYKKKKSCGLAHASATSFFPAKPLGCYGDGGAIFTDNRNLAEKLFSIRVHGQGTNKYDNIRLGLNGRLDTMQAAVLLEKLEIFHDEFEKRNEIAQYFNSKLPTNLKPQKVSSNCQSSWASYALLCENKPHRTKIILNLEKYNIPSKIYYEKPLHLQKMFSYRNYNKGDFPISEKICERIFSIPFHPYMSKNDMNKIIDSINV